MTRAKTDLAALALVVAATLAGCSGNEAEKVVARATSPLPGALAALGLRNLSWDKAEVDGRRVSLRDAKADMDGFGPVTIRELSVLGFRQESGSWGADAVQADGVDGAIRVSRASVSAARAKPVGNGWAVSYESRSVDGLAGRLDGLSLTAAHVEERRYDTGGDERFKQVAYAARGLVLADDPALPPVARTLAGKSWDIGAKMLTGSGGRADLQVIQADTADWRIRGRVSLVLPRDGATAPSGPALFSPSAWPAGYALGGLEADLTLARPRDLLALAGNPTGVVGTLVETGRKLPAARWHVEALPREPVAFRDLQATLDSPGADVALDVTARGDGIPPELAVPPSTRLAGRYGEPPGRQVPAPGASAK